MGISTDYTSGFEYYYSPLTDSSKNEESPQDIKSISEATESKENKTGKTSEEELTDEEKKEVDELQKRDLEVRAHEQAHIAAGGSYVRGGPSFSYQTGPDGKRYAVGGEVSIDTSAVSGDPQATIQKMQAVRKAALAPASPSSTDRSVASAASQKMNAARMELAKERTESSDGADKEKSGKDVDEKKKSFGYNENASSITDEVITGKFVDYVA